MGHGISNSGQAEIQDETAAMSSIASFHDEVLWLEVPVNHTTSVGVRQRISSLNADMNRNPPRQATRVTADLRERLASDVLHGKKSAPIDEGPKVESRNDVRVAETSDGESLTLESQANLLATVRSPVEDLERQIALQPEMTSEPHPRRASVTERPNQLKPTSRNDRPGHESSPAPR